MRIKIMLVFAIASMAMLNAAADEIELGMERYQEAENFLYARTPEQVNFACYYACGFENLCSLYYTFKNNKTLQDDTLCAKVTLALAKVLFEQVVFVDGRGGYNVSHHQKSFELFNEVITCYPACKDPNTIAQAKFYLAEHEFFGCTKPQDFERAMHLYQEIIHNPAVTDNNIVAWAKGRLADSYRDGKGVQQDYSKSMQLWQEIIDNSDNISDKSIVAWAEFAVAEAYEQGIDREKDVKKAIFLFEKITTTYVTSDPSAVIHAHERLEKLI